MLTFMMSSFTKFGGLSFPPADGSLKAITDSYYSNFLAFP